MAIMGRNQVSDKTVDTDYPKENEPVFDGIKKDTKGVPFSGIADSYPYNSKDGGKR